jgi:hypothetical protein
MIPAEKIPEAKKALEDYILAAKSEVHLIAKEFPYMSIFPQHYYEQASHRTVDPSRILWGSQAMGTPECPEKYKKIITERCVGRAISDVIREFKTGSLYPKVYADVGVSRAEMKKQLVKDHWPAVFVIEERTMDNVPVKLPFKMGPQVIHSSPDTQLIQYVGYQTGVKPDDLWEFFFETPEGKEILRNAVSQAGLEWTAARNGRSPHGSPDVRYGELSSDEDLSVEVVVYSSLGGVLKDQPNYQDEVVFKLGRYQDTMPEELLDIANHEAFVLAKHLWNREYVKSLDDFFPPIPGVPATERSNKRGPEISRLLKKSLNTDPALVKFWEKAKASLPGFFKSSQLLNYGFTLNHLIAQADVSSPSRVLKLKSGDLYEFALLLYKKKLADSRMSKIDTATLPLDTRAFQGVAQSAAVSEFLSKHPKTFRIADIEVFDAEYRGRGKRAEFPKGIHSIQQLKLGTDLKILVKKVSTDQRVFADKQNYAFQLVWTTPAAGSIPSSEDEARRAYGERPASPTMRTYLYGPNTHAETGIPDPGEEYSGTFIKQGIVLAWIRFTVLPEEDGVVLDEVQTDMTNRQYELLGSENGFMQGWEHLTMKYFLHYVRKVLKYQKVFAPTPAAKVGRYRAMATVPVLNDFYSTLWDDFAFQKQPITDGVLEGFRVLDENRAQLLDVRSMIGG